MGTELFRLNGTLERDPLRRLIEAAYADMKSRVENG